MAPAEAEIRELNSTLGGPPVVGRQFRNEADVQSAIREGLPQGVLDEVMRSSGLSLKELAASLDLAPRSLQRRRKEGRLARYESDRVYRLARIIALARIYLGDPEAAVRWLKRPNRALDGQAPLEMIDTEPGVRAVERVLGRIAYGGIS